MRTLLALACLSLSLSAVATDHKRHASPKHYDNTYSYNGGQYYDAGYSSGKKRFKCFNAWGQKLHGKFSRSEKRLVELGGGDCRKIRRGHDHHFKYGDLSAIKAAGFPVRKVYSAIDEVKRTYGLYNAKIIAATKVKLKKNKIKYTLIVNEGRYNQRMFVVKQKRGNGKVTMIKEVWS